MNTTAPGAGSERQRSRVDLHCHSSASEESRLGVQRAVGLPECATPPWEVYELAKRRGMDFVTITDHDTIDGVSQIAGQPDVFVSEELTANFRDEEQAVHILCFGITGEDHEWLQGHRWDVEQCAAYLHEREIACALAHPYYAVAAALSRRHRRRLAELFPVWEVRNGARAPQLNHPAAMYIATREGIGIGGSDDHAGIDVGRTFTQGPGAESPRGVPPAPMPGKGDRPGRPGQRREVGPRGDRAGDPLARVLRPRRGGARVDPERVMRMVGRLLREADARHGQIGGDLTPADALCLLDGWRGAVGLRDLDEAGMLEMMQAEGFSHGALFRRACRAHERTLRSAVGELVATVQESGLRAPATGARRPPGACSSRVSR